MRRLSPNIAEVSSSSTHADGDDPFANLTLGQHTIDRIGNTPLLRLARIGSESPGVEILGKAEWLNPGGSVKDRAAANIVATARASGR